MQKIVDAYRAWANENPALVRLFRELDKAACATADGSVTQPEAEPAPYDPDASPRRRRRATEEAPAAQPVADPSPELGGRRRRRSGRDGATASETPATPAAEASAPAPSGERRRRRHTSEEAPAAPEADPTSSAPASRRRRAMNAADDGVTSSASVSTAATKSPSDGLTDEDLTKAASAAAQKVGPAMVKEIIKGFKVDSTGDIPQAQRRQFIVALDTACAA